MNTKGIMGKVIFTIVGIGLLVGAFFSTKSTMVFLKNAERLEGRVVDNQKESNSDGETMYSAVVEYEYDGKVDRFTSSISSNRKTEEGKVVEVMYDDGTGRVEIYSFLNIWVMPTTLGLMGLLFTGAGIFVKSENMKFNKII